MKDLFLNKHLVNILNNGYTVVNNVIAKNECIKLKKIGKKIYKDYGKKIKIKNPLEETIYNLHNKNKKFLKYINFKKTFPIVKKALSIGGYKNNCDIIIRQVAMRNPKKGHAQQLHNDTRIIGCRYPLVIHVIYMLDDFTKDNGATRLVPKSHRKNSYPLNNKVYQNEKKIYGKQGDALLFDASLWHGSSKKIKEQDRWGMIFSYSRWFLKPDFDFNKNTPDKIFKKLNKNQKTLLGFKSNPMKDEFTRASSLSNKFEKPSKYKLPN